MERTVYLGILFDIYGDLFTEKQQHYFEEYYFHNLTLNEISENYQVTKNAVFKSLKETEDKLLFYEDKLKIYEKNKKILKLVEHDEKLKKQMEEIL